VKSLLLRQLVEATDPSTFGTVTRWLALPFPIVIACGGNGDATRSSNLDASVSETAPSTHDASLSEADPSIDDASLGSPFVPDGWEAGCFGADSTPIDKGLLTGSIPACAEGSAHPNVCCHAGPNQATACAEDPDNPFRACGCDSLTFPDPRTCCSLDDGGGCTTPGQDAATGGSCTDPCGPDTFSPHQVSWATTWACSDVPSVLTDAGLIVSCFLCCNVSITVSGLATPTEPGCYGNVGSCPPKPLPGTNVPPCPDPTFGCDAACPVGWARASAFPGLCCRGDGGTSSECFSQAETVSK
jgi:hypothetical protein